MDKTTGTPARPRPDGTCVCGACARESMLLAVFDGKCETPPVTDYPAPTFRDLAALEHAENPITARDVETARETLSAVKAAMKRQELRSFQVRPALVGDADFSIVANFLNCAQRVVIEQMSNGSFDMKDAADRERMRERITTLVDFERFFLVPATRAGDSLESRADELMNALGKLLGFPPFPPRPPFPPTSGD